MSDERRRPNLLIVGAAKCGTTTLAHLLREHPQVFMSRQKELTFFVPDDVRRTPSWHDYLGHFEGVGGHQIVGEASVAYLWCEDSPRRISERLGDNVRIVVQLRNPVDMAYSLWGHQRRLEREPLSFADAIDAEPARARGAGDLRGWRANFLYVARACTVVQIARYHEVFGRDRVYCTVLEDLRDAPTDVFGALCRWLGVEPRPVDELPRLNPAGRAASPGLRRLLDGDSTLKRWGKRLVPDVIRLPLRGRIERANRRQVELEPMSSDVRRHLEERFAADVATLSAWTARDLHARWFGDAKTNDGDPS